MNGGLLALGVSHKTAPVALRERLALSEGRASGFLRELLTHPEVHEAVAISTCNRTELHMVVGDPVEAENAALSALSRQAGIRPTELLGRIYSMRGGEAVRHLFSVAAGLDSMIVGEAEVQGQVKRAYELALVEGVTGPIANRLFRDALVTGKRARTETAISRSHVSISSVAVELARGVLGDLEKRRVLVVGAGEQGELTARALHESGARTVFIANRRYDRAIGLAQRFDGEAVRFDDLPRELAEADIVVTCTASPHQILGHTEMAVVAEERGGRPLLMIDIAVPRDIDPTVREIAGITLYDMDDLQREVARNMSGREAEAERVRTIVAEEAERFEDWLAGLDVVPTIAAIHERGEEIVQSVLSANAGRWESMSQADMDRIEAVGRSIISRLLHEPTLRLKRAADQERSYVFIQALRELMGLDPEDLGSAAGGAEVSSLEAHRQAARARGRSDS
ncbi:MAG: glutamyl-tRNA reductase [Thermoleophilaceae bacterium]|nr:glutamyl-tRNA reductase [Thermoleophilaceae bacterium]